MIPGLLHVCAVLLLLIVVAVLVGAVVWAYLEAFDKVLRLFGFHRNLCEYFIHRKSFRVWISRVKGEKQRAINRTAVAR